MTDGIIQLSNITNTVINSDCMEIMKHLPDKCIDVVITDPPYGIGINKMNYVTSGAIIPKNAACRRTDYKTHNTNWDNTPLSSEQFNEIVRISKNQIIFGANNFSNILPSSRCWIVWDKRTQDKYNNDFADCELIWTSFNKPSRIIRWLWSGMLQGDMKNKEKRYHPTQKPIKVMSEIITRFTNENDLILDCFSGVGSTLIACKNNNRRFIGIEIEEKYVQISNDRLNLV